jgi:S1-C subfamily serine protease
MSMNVYKILRNGAYIALLFVLILGVARQGFGLPQPAQALAAAPTPAAAQTGANASMLASDFSAAIRDVAQKVKPAVVQITNEQTQVDMFTQQPFTVPAGVGSGVIYDSQGHILTNDHVVEGAQTLLVSLPGGRDWRFQPVAGRRLGSGDRECPGAARRPDRVRRRGQCPGPHGAGAWQ